MSPLCPVFVTILSNACHQTVRCLSPFCPEHVTILSNHVTVLSNYVTILSSYVTILSSHVTILSMVCHHSVHRMSPFCPTSEKIPPECHHFVQSMISHSLNVTILSIKTRYQHMNVTILSISCRFLLFFVSKPARFFLGNRAICVFFMNYSY